MTDENYYIQQVLAGNHKAFGVLVNKYQNLVFTAVFRLLRSREDAEEAAQDAFVKAFKMLKTYQGQAKFSTWLYKIAHHTAIDYARRKKIVFASLTDESTNFAMQLPDDKWLNQLEKLQNQDVQHFLEKAIAYLTPDERILINLYYLNEKSITETAILTGLSVSNVKVKMLRIRQKLKQQLIFLLHHEANELL